MGVAVKWYVPGRVAFMRLSGELNREAIQELNAQMRSFIEAGTPLVHFVGDDHDVKVAGIKLSDINQIFEVLRHPAFGWTIAMSESTPMAQLLTQLGAQVTRIRFRRFQTREDALAFLKVQDQTINWDAADASVFAQTETTST